MDGRERTFIVQFPKESHGKLPVVFFFHGGGGRARNVAVPFQNMAARENFVAVYRQGGEKNGNNGNDGRKAKAIPAQVENVDHVRFVRAIAGNSRVRRREGGSYPPLL
jgi:poly(3-hydroxybutyrate) depolymerase